MKSIETWIKEAAAALSLDACGIAPITMDGQLLTLLQNAGSVPFAPEDLGKRIGAETLLPGARSAIVCLFPYKPEMPEKGNLALYARPLDYHLINRRYLFQLETALREKFPEARFFPLVDTAPLVDRWLAFRAGLGFYGKNHCLIHPKYGSFFTIGTLLTSLSLTPGTPSKESCGTCRRCLAACPGRALTENRMDPWRCKSYLTQKKAPLTKEEEEIISRTPFIFGCDECQRVCPWNEKAAPSPLPEIAEARIPELTKAALETLSNRAFEREYKNYAFAWRGKKVLLRNAEIIEKARQ